MKLVIRELRRFIRSEGGMTAEEYAVVAAIFAIVCFTTYSALGS